MKLAFNFKKKEASLASAIGGNTKIEMNDDEELK